MPSSSSKKRKSASVVATIAAAATHFGVADRTLQRWIARGCPGEPGKYDLAAIAAWREANLGRARDDTATHERVEWDTRAARASALMKEMELKEREGRLIDVDQAAAVVGRHVAEVKAHLQQLPDYAASLVKLPAGKKRVFVEAMRQKIRSLCTTFEHSLIELAEAAAGNDVDV